MSKRGIEGILNTIVIVLITIILVLIMWFAVSEAKNRIFG